MKVRPEQSIGVCEGCGDEKALLNVVTFKMADTVKLLCNNCLEWAREVLALVGVKEAEA